MFTVVRISYICILNAISFTTPKAATILNLMKGYTRALESDHALLTKSERLFFFNQQNSISLVTFLDSLFCVSLSHINTNQSLPFYKFPMALLTLKHIKLGKIEKWVLRTYLLIFIKMTPRDLGLWEHQSCVIPSHFIYRFHKISSIFHRIYSAPKGTKGAC